MRSTFSIGKLDKYNLKRGEIENHIIPNNYIRIENKTKHLTRITN